MRKDVYLCKAQSVFMDYLESPLVCPWRIPGHETPLSRPRTTLESTSSSASFMCLAFISLDGSMLISGTKKSRFITQAFAHSR